MGEVMLATTSNMSGGSLKKINGSGHGFSEYATQIQSQEAVPTSASGEITTSFKATGSIPQAKFSQAPWGTRYQSAILRFRVWGFGI